jgi:arginyl-tRNA--protein-N-Asp/Glu arginylyltransferase
MISIPLILTQDHPCSYLEGERAQSLFVHPACRLTSALYGQLLALGFRRSGDEVYAPCCGKCSACIPARVPVDEFKPDRSQKRCLKRNRNTRVIIKPAIFEQAHYEMYLRYQNFKHEGGAMTESSPYEYLNFLGSSWCNTCFAEFSIGNELSAVAVIDQFDQSWSAVYTFFEPKFYEYSPGMYAVLWQIEQARRLQKKYLYLGFWIKNCRKMAYKSVYQPLQLYVGQQWVEFVSADN